MKIAVHELNHTALHVRDLEASMRFYGEILELPAIPRPAFGFPGAWYAFGAQELHLIEDDAARAPERVRTHFALRVDNALAARAELERRGVSGIRQMLRPDGFDQIYFLDPDGFEIELFSPVRE